MLNSPSQKGPGPNRTPLTHTRSFSASQHRSLLASLRYSFVFHRNSGAPQSCQNPQQSPIFIETPNPPDGEILRSTASSAKAQGSLRLVRRHGGAPSGSGRMQIQQQHPRSAPPLRLCPLPRSAAVSREEKGWAHLTGARRRRRARGRPGHLGPWPTAASSVAQSSPRHRESSRLTG